MKIEHATISITDFDIAKEGLRNLACTLLDLTEGLPANFTRNIVFYMTKEEQDIFHKALEEYDELMVPRKDIEKDFVKSNEYLFVNGITITIKNKNSITKEDLSNLGWKYDTDNSIKNTEQEDMLSNYTLGTWALNYFHIPDYSVYLTHELFETISEIYTKEQLQEVMQKNNII